MNSVLTKHKNYLVQLLSRREYSRLELSQKLKKRGLNETEIQQLFDYLDIYQYQSDQRVADMIINKHLLKLQGRNKILQSAYQKGLSEDLIDEILDHKAINWQKIASQCYQKKYTSMAINDDEISWPEKQKRLKYLVSQGFEFDIALSVIQL